MVADLQITTREQGEFSVVEVGGEIDVYTAPSLREAVPSVLDGGAIRICIDLSDVSFLDSTGLGVIVNAMKRVDAAKGHLTVVVTKSHLTKVFEITGLDAPLDIRDSTDTL